MVEFQDPPDPHGSPIEKIQTARERLLEPVNIRDFLRYRSEADSQLERILAGVLEEYDRRKSQNMVRWLDEEEKWLNRHVHGSGLPGGFNEGYDPFGFLYVGGGSSLDTIYKISGSGTGLVWQRSVHEHVIDDIVADSSGNTYSVSRGGSLVKLDVNGSVLWEDTTGITEIWKVHLDESAGFIYASGNFGTSIGDNGFRRYTLDGTVDLEVIVGDTKFRGVVADSDGNIYGMYGKASVGNISKWDSAGNIQWTYTGLNGVPYDGGIDSNGFVYAINASGVHKVTPEGGLSWLYSMNGTEGSLYVDSLSNVFAAGNDFKVHKINNAGSSVWKYTYDIQSIKKLDVDPAGNIYFVAGAFTVKLTPLGVFEWEYEITGESLWSVAGYS